MVIWLIGLSGSGKTSIGREIYKILKEKKKNTVLIDGDEIRAIFKHDKGALPYTIEGRYKNAQRICALCKWLDSQDINVVCCILSIFEESRLWNRNTYSSYYEVFIDVPLEILFNRDYKKLYASAQQGKMDNVVGIDIPFEKPENPDYVFDNSAEKNDFTDVAADIVAKCMGLNKLK